MQLIYPTSGRAEILGRPAGDLAVRRRIGYLPENPYFYDHLTAEELLLYFAALFDYREPERSQRVARLLDQVGIGAARRMQLRKFSKGMMQRVGIAQALINDPAVVFLDEPMSGLDPIGRREVRQLVLALRDRGCTVFFSSHILADAEALCSRVAIVAGGRLAAEGRLSDLLAFEVRGWELVVADLDRAVIDRLGAVVRRFTEISAGRYALELTLEVPPERVLGDVLATGARLVSLTPVRDTIEDFFMRQVAEAGNREADRLDGEGADARR
jgi:ABC-2 type transport system ATP-binding protein